MKTYRLLICLAIIPAMICTTVKAQQQEPIQPPPTNDDSFWDKIYIGGNFGLQFGTTTVVNLSPQVGYRVTEKFVPGIGITYIYYSYKIPNYKRVESNIYGGSVFSKYFFTPNLFAHGEFEELNLEAYDDSIPPHIIRRWVPSLFVGGGYNQPLGQRGFIQLLLLFEVLQDRNSPYLNRNPVVRIGFGF
jgi:hypothetical protein